MDIAERLKLREAILKLVEPAKITERTEAIAVLAQDVGLPVNSMRWDHSAAICASNVILEAESRGLTARLKELLAQQGVLE